MQWFYIRNEQRFGPVEEAELFRLAGAGGLSPEDLVWNPTMGEEWKPASEVPGLFAAAAPAAGNGIPGSTPNGELMARARESLSGQWGLAVGVALLYQVVTMGASFLPYLGGIVALLITGAMTLGWSGFFLNVARRRPADVGQLFDGFKFFGKALGTYLLMVLFIALWSLIAVVPGILAAVMIPALQRGESDAMVLMVPVFAFLFVLAMIPSIRAQFAYSQAFFVLSDDPGCGALDAIRRSKAMMDGFKWKYFCLGFRFIGWALLSMLTCGIGLLWLVPYVMTSYAHFHDDVRGNA